MAPAAVMGHASVLTPSLGPHVALVNLISMVTRIAHYARLLRVMILVVAMRADSVLVIKGSRGLIAGFVI